MAKIKFNQDMRLRMLHSDELPLPRLVATIELVTCMVTPSALNSRYLGVAHGLVIAASMSNFHYHCALSTEIAGRTRLLV